MTRIAARMQVSLLYRHAKTPRGKTSAGFYSEAILLLTELSHRPTAMHFCFVPHTRRFRNIPYEHIVQSVPSSNPHVFIAVLIIGLVYACTLHQPARNTDEIWRLNGRFKMRDPRFHLRMTPVARGYDFVCLDLAVPLKLWRTAARTE